MDFAQSGDAHTKYLCSDNYSKSRGRKTNLLMSVSLTSNKHLIACERKHYGQTGQYGIRGKIASLIQALYSKTPNAVRMDGHLSEWFETMSGVRQGDVLSPHLFNIFIFSVAREVFGGVEGQLKFT